ncbi:MAG TPA: heme exporter protein CcmB [Candidatus Thermoplasmatota archaeon]|nr:heme exporter protein CcmB [Candidatus Thermoplasmatota archaeon]
MRAAFLVAAKDLRVEGRTRDLVNAMLLLALLVLAVGLVAYHDLHERAVVASGVLWTAVVFASALASARSFANERDRGTLDVLLGAPADRGDIFLGKTIAHATLLLAVETAVLPLYAWLSPDLGGVALGTLAVIAVLATVGLAAAATILAAVATAARAREALVPVLLLPVAMPVVISAIHATTAAFEGAGLSEVAGEAALLAGFAIIVLALGWYLFEEVVA